MKFTFATEEGGFDSHIENSIRGYANLFNDIIKVSRYFVDNESKVVDIGCSTGRLVKPMYETNKDIEIEDSEEDVLSEFRDFLDDVSPEDFSA